MLKIQKNIILTPMTTFKIGGPAQYFVKVNSEEKLLEAVKYAQEKNWAIFILGGGSNILISDKGFAGLVIKMSESTEKKNTIKLLEANKIECWAGNSLAQMVNFSLNRELSGFEWAVGIPGSVGGALRGNAGAYGNCIADRVVEIKVLDKITKKIKIFKKTDCHFGYRESIFKKEKRFIILNVLLKMEKGEKKRIKEKAKEIIQKRQERLPSEFSAGSFFQNPTVNNKKLIKQFEEEQKVKVRNNKIPAGWLIETVGLKGKKIGGVQVSEKHANFIVNNGQGKAEEIIMLASLIKMKVRDELGVQLKEEVLYIGF